MNEAMAGKTCVVTGATSGIGLVTARELARKGARVIIVGRSAERAAEAVAVIERETGAKQVMALTADLSCHAEIRRLAQALRERTPQLDVLVNNAGGIFLERLESPDGVEMTFALNHLSYFHLTNLVLPLMVDSARIVNVASDAHRGVSLDFDDLEGKKQFGGWRAYQRSKLANILFTAELARRLEGTGVTCNCLHPGFVRTKIFRDPGWVGMAIRAAARFALTPEQGARTSISLATSPEVARATGGYYTKERAATPSRAARDPVAAQRLWEISLAMTGLADRTTPRPG